MSGAPGLASALYADHAARREQAARIFVALAMSVLAHVGAMFGIQVRPPDLPTGGPVVAITARIVSDPVGDFAPEPFVEPRPVTGTPSDETTTDAGNPEIAAAASDVASSPRQVSAPTPPAGQGQGAVPMALDTTYYPARLLDEYPRPVAPVEPTYPGRASMNDVAGKVVLLLLIDEIGRVNEVSVMEAAPPGYFEEAALAAFSNVRFVPGRKDGRPVRSRILITVDYESEKLDRPRN